MKRNIRDLALFDGSPEFAEPLHVGRPNVGDRSRFLDRVNDILDRRWLTNDGIYVRELEERIAAISGVRHAVAMCNATLALELLADALALSGEVILPSFTFVATAHAMRRRGLTPVFADISPRTHSIDPAAVEAAITPATSAILAVHLWGHPCDVEALTEIARRHRLTLLFDAAHALASFAGGRPVGSFGAAEVFSFHATKFVNSFEGGAVVTNDDALARQLRRARNFGFVDYDNVSGLGTNAKMHEVSAAMGVTSLESIDEIIAANERNHRLYEARLAGIDGLRFVSGQHAEKTNFQYVAIEWDEERTLLARDTLLQILRAENVYARRYFYPGCHRMEPYRSTLPLRHPLPATERAAASILVLPSGPAASPEAVVGVSQIVRFCAEQAAAITEWQSAAALR
jgi:dTDP-4-amino-4,6-dideoxygalactose transaminase